MKLNKWQDLGRIPVKHVEYRQIEWPLDARECYKLEQQGWEFVGLHITEKNIRVAIIRRYLIEQKESCG